MNAPLEEALGYGGLRRHCGRRVKKEEVGRQVTNPIATRMEEMSRKA